MQGGTVRLLLKLSLCIICRTEILYWPDKATNPQAFISEPKFFAVMPCTIVTCTLECTTTHIITMKFFMHHVQPALFNEYLRSFHFLNVMQSMHYEQPVWQDVSQHINADLNKCVDFCDFFFLIKLNTSLPIGCFIYPSFSTFTKGLIIGGAVFMLPYYMRFISCKVNCINCQYTQGDTGSMPEEKSLFKFSQHSINQLFI